MKSFKKIIEELENEMRDHCEKRTKIHLSNVQYYCDLISKGEKNLKELKQRGIDHDKSKFSDEEKTAYIYISWRYKQNGNYQVNKKTEKIIKNAWNHHIENNRHHPDYFKNHEDMTNLDIAEMCADWLAMSKELKDNVIKFADNNINKWNFTKKQKEYIYYLLNKYKDK